MVSVDVKHNIPSLLEVPSWKPRRCVNREVGPGSHGVSWTDDLLHQSVSTGGSVDSLCDCSAELLKEQAAKYTSPSVEKQEQQQWPHGATRQEQLWGNV